MPGLLAREIIKEIHEWTSPLCLLRNGGECIVWEVVLRPPHAEIEAG